MHASRESLINFYNPPSTTPVRSANSHYTADPFRFPPPTHHRFCPHCRAQNESLVTRLPYRDPTVGRTATSIHTTSPDDALA